MMGRHDRGEAGRAAYHQEASCDEQGLVEAMHATKTPGTHGKRGRRRPLKRQRHTRCRCGGADPSSIIGGALHRILQEIEGQIEIARQTFVLRMPFARDAIRMITAHQAEIGTANGCDIGARIDAENGIGIHFGYCTLNRRAPREGGRPLPRNNVSLCPIRPSPEACRPFQNLNLSATLEGGKAPLQPLR